MTRGPLTGALLRERFLTFFASQGHAIIPSGSLIPENDPTVLFTTAGMQPLVPYLLGQPHPQGKRLASAQKCLRTDDIEGVGDAMHLTFFEMLGNWSLGDYFKEEAITWSHELLVSDRWLGIPLDRLAVTIFAGDADAPRDEEAARIWHRLGVLKERIFSFGKTENWWGPAGQTGPCGPDTEMFYDTGKPSCGRPTCGPNCPCGKWVEIWNDVFMEFEKTADGRYAPLAQKNVDTGMGLERTVAVLTGRESVFETDLFSPIVEALLLRVQQADTRQIRIAADHLRAAIFILSDTHDVLPSNVEQGYVLRRLIRRAIRSLRLFGSGEQEVAGALRAATTAVAATFGSTYPEVRDRQSHTDAHLLGELQKYLDVERRAERLLARLREQGHAEISGAEAFRIYQETGAHPDLLASLGPSYGMIVDVGGFEAEFQRHQDVSRAGITQRFAGGLADHSEQTTKLHTATHLLHAALRKVLGAHVEQKGSNITPERLRFDFTHPTKLTPEELRAVEDLVNEQIRRDLPVTAEVLSPEEAKRQGALGFFEHKYGDQVNVYSIGEFSKEVCGGPHVAHTGVLGHFRMTKEGAVSAGIRRIRAVVEPHG